MRNGTARTRHLRHRSFSRMNRQEIIPNFLDEQADRLGGAGTVPVYAETFEWADNGGTIGTVEPTNAVDIGPFDFSNTEDDWEFNEEAIDVEASVAGGAKVVTFDATTNVVTITGTTLTDGDGPFYLSQTGGALPGGTTGDLLYWAKNSAATVHTLHRNREDAIAGTSPVDFSSAGSGTISLNPAYAIALDAHGLEEGFGPLRVDAGGTIAAGLSNDAIYFAVPNGDDQIVLATSLANIDAKTFVKVTAAGSEAFNLIAANVFQKTAHGLSDGDGPYYFGVENWRENTISLGQPRFIRAFDADHFSFVWAKAGTGPVVYFDTEFPVGPYAVPGTLWTLAAHGMTDGIPYVFNGEDLSAPMADGERYAIHSVGDDNFVVRPVDVTDEQIDEAVHDLILPTLPEEVVTVDGVDGIWLDGDVPATGSGPYRLTTGTTLPDGLELATDYYGIDEGDGLFNLAASEADAIAGVAVTIGDAGTGTHTITSTDKEGGDAVTFTATAATDVCAAAGHGFADCEGPVICASSGTLPGGLSSGQFYYIDRVDANSFKLATTPQRANLGQAVDITSVGTGNHTVRRATTAAALFEVNKRHKAERIATADDIDDLA